MNIITEVIEYMLKHNTYGYNTTIERRQYLIDELKKTQRPTTQDTKRGREMKKYTVIDLQQCNFMDDTHDEPMTMDKLRKRFWSLDECRSKNYKNFTKEYIEDMWEVEIKEA